MIDHGFSPPKNTRNIFSSDNDDESDDPGINDDPLDLIGQLHSSNTKSDKDKPITYQTVDGRTLELDVKLDSLTEELELAKMLNS